VFRSSTVYVFARAITSGPFEPFLNRVVCLVLGLV
jgi:hypothetical protein